MLSAERVAVFHFTGTAQQGCSEFLVCKFCNYLYMSNMTRSMKINGVHAHSHHFQLCVAITSSLTLPTR